MLKVFYHTFVYLEAHCQDQNVFQTINLHESNFSQSNLCPIKPPTFILVFNSSSSRNLLGLASQVTSGEDVESLLDHLKWRIFVYTCENQHYCNNITNIEYGLQNTRLENTSCCFSDKPQAIFASKPSCDSSNCTDFLASHVITKWYIFFILGMLCLFGNLFVIVQKIIALRKQQYQQKSLKIYHILVLNLAFSDLFMGIYLVAISLEIQRKVADDIYFSNHGLCHILGVINSVSTQVSLCVLLIISVYRLIGLTSPYKHHHVKVVIAVLLFTWLLWLTIALLPAVSLEPLATKFTLGIARDNKLIKDYFFDIFQVTKLLQKFTSSSSEIDSILKAVSKYPTRSVLSKIHDQFGWINLAAENWSYVEYYDIQYACATNFFAQMMNMHSVAYLIAFYIFFNLTTTVAILVTYVLVTLLVSGNENIAYFLKCSGPKQNETTRRRNSVQSPRNVARNNENHKIYARISVIIITDFVLMFPLFLAALVNFFKPMTLASTDILKSVINVQTVLLFVVPFNSILNPYIYSLRFWSRFLQKLRKKERH